MSIRYSSVSSRRITDGSVYKQPETISQLTVYLLDGTSIRVAITDTLRSLELVSIIAKEIHLQTFLDYKLVLTDW